MLHDTCSKRTMSLIMKYEQLPLKLQEALASQGYCEKSFVCGLKTAHKLKYGIPFTWMLLTNSCLALCTTHQDRRIISIYTKNNLNSIRSIQDSVGHYSIELIHKDLDTPTLTLQLPTTASAEDISTFLQLSSILQDTMNEKLG